LTAAKVILYWGMIDLSNPAHVFVLLIVFALWGAANYFAAQNKSTTPMTITFVFWIFLIAAIASSFTHAIFNQL